MQRIDEVEDLAKRGDAAEEVDLSQPLPPLNLANGHWAIRVEGERVWHQAQYVTVTGDTAVVLDVRPRAFVTGKIATTAKLPRELLLRVEGVSSNDESCAIDDGAFHCAIPAAPVYLRLRARGFVAHTFPGLRLAPGESRDLGTLTLRRGQSITGRVELPREWRRELAQVKVRAELAGLIDGDRPLARGGSLVPISAEADAKGNFHIDGVTAGAWVVRARHGKRVLWAEPVTITVKEGIDAAITRPMLLDRPHRIEVSIVPPRDPDGRPWTVGLTREVRAGHVEPVIERPARGDGNWSSNDLLPGTYTCSIRTSSGDEWHYETVILGTTDAEVHAVFEPATARGVVRFGGKPLKATLELMSKARSSTSVTSDDEGRFTIKLPSREMEMWQVRIAAEQPPVHTTVEQLEITPDKEVTIDVRDITLRGEVVDEQGEPVPYPIIRLLDRGGRIDVNGTEAGTFAFAGQEPGPITLQGSADRFREGDPQTFVIPEDGDPAPVRLIVRKQKPLRGYVVSGSVPVGGARIVVRPSNIAFGFLPAPRTDATGRFTAWVPPDTQELDLIVTAPGFSYMMDHVQYRDSVLRVSLDQAGGTLTYRGPENAQIVHAGAIMPAPSVAFDSGGTSSSSETVMPRMEPGPYAVCVVDDAHRAIFRASNGTAGARCASGILPPNGSLTLELSGTNIAAR